MKTILSCLAVFAAAYFVGGINPAYIISKRFGFDIRKTGTGNAGASNAVLSFGKRAGALIALADIMKAFLIIKLSGLVFPAVRISKELAGTGCIIGHIFPAQLRFKGGKGLSCLGGVILAFSPKCFLIMLLAEIVLALIAGYSSVIPITAAIVFPAVYMGSGGCWTGFALYIGAASVMELKHIENIRRIRAGTEIRVSYLWDMEKEMLRIQENSRKSDMQPAVEEVRTWENRNEPLS